MLWLRKESLASRVALKSTKPPDGKPVVEEEPEKEARLERTCPA